STISSTASPMQRWSSENTSKGCAPLVLILTSSAAGTRGINRPRYWIIGRPFDTSIVLASISSNRVTRDSGTALGLGDPARKRSMTSSGAAFRLTGALRHPDLMGDAVRIQNEDHRPVAHD